MIYDFMDYEFLIIFLFGFAFYGTAPNQKHKRRARAFRMNLFEWFISLLALNVHPVSLRNRLARCVYVGVKRNAEHFILSPKEGAGSSRLSYLIYALFCGCLDD